MSNCIDIRPIAGCFTPTDGRPSVSVIIHVIYQESQAIGQAFTLSNSEQPIDPATYLGGGTISIGKCANETQILKSPVCFELDSMVYKGWEIEGINQVGTPVFRYVRDTHGTLTNSDSYTIVECPCCDDNTSRPSAPQAVDDTGFVLPYGEPSPVQVDFNDNPCPNGQTTDYRLVIGSEVNVIVTPSVTATGVFTATPIALGAWSFQYDIYCDGAYSGETATVSGQGVNLVAATDDPAYERLTGIPFVIDTTPNDLLCQAPQVTTWQVIPGSIINANVIQNPVDIDGIFTVTPLLDGPFEFLYELVCDGTPTGEIARVYGEGVTPSIEVQKIADVQGLGVAGDTILYNFIVTNTGTADLTNIIITDPLVTVLGGPIPLLPIGASDSTTFTATHLITPADIITGTVTNQATVTGTPPNGLPNVSDLSDDPSDLTGDNDPTVVVVPESEITLEKTGVLASPNPMAGDVINYTFTVTNTGVVPLTNVVVNDPLITVLGGPIALLAAGATDTTTFTGSYILTQADIDAGGVTNQATATGTNPDGLPVSDLSDDPTVIDGNPDTPTVVDVPRTPAMTVAKAGSILVTCDPAAPVTILPTYDGVTPAGFGVAPLGWTIINGTTDISDVNAWGGDPLYGWIGAPVALPPTGDPLWVSGYRDEIVGTTISGLDVGSVYTFNFHYGLFAPIFPTAGDGEWYYRSPEVDIRLDGVVIDQYTIAGAPTDSQPTWGDHEITFTATAATMELSFQNGAAYRAFNGTPANPAYAWNISFGTLVCKTVVANTIDYTFTVTNTGNVDLTNVQITDPLVTILGGPIPLLPVGATDSTTFTATYTLTQDNRYAGQVINQATGTADYVGGSISELSDDITQVGDNDPTIVTFPAEPLPTPPSGNYDPDDVDYCNHFDEDSFANLFDGNTVQAGHPNINDHRLHQNCTMTWEFLTPYTASDSIQIYWSNAQQAGNDPDEIIGLEILVSDDGGATTTSYFTPTELVPFITGDQVFDITPGIAFNWMGIRSILSEDVGADPFIWEITISNIPNV